MSIKLIIALLGLGGLLGVVIGYFLRFLITLGKKGSMELEVKQMELKAKEEADKIVEGAKKKAEDFEKEKREEAKEREDKIAKNEERLIKKEELLDKRQGDIEKEVEHIKLKAIEVKEIKDRTEAIEQEKRTELERISGLTGDMAKEELFKLIEKQAEEDLLVRMQKVESFATEKIERKAKEILVSAIHRFGNSVASDTMATSVTIPNDEIKGKIIGKEGRTTCQEGLSPSLTL
jgi:ribonuclease Y